MGYEKTHPGNYIGCHYNKSIHKIKPKETTMKVYSGLWEMPCDLKREPWCEVVIKVLERHNPYRLRFEGKPKLMWYNESKLKKKK